MATAKTDAKDITPEWLDEELIAGVLHRREVLPVKVHQLRVTRAVPVGENYGSALLRVGVDYTVEEDAYLKSTSLIVKCLPSGEMSGKSHRGSEPFDRETKMYTTTLPALEAILNEGTEGEKINFAPQIYPVDREHTIVLQDLCELGFRMRDRQVGLDLAHATLVLRNLARYHAASVALHARDPGHPESYHDVIFVAEKRKEIDAFFLLNFRIVAKVVESWEQQDPKKYAGYAEKFRAFTLTAIDHMLEAVKPSTTFLNVLNHGDCWTNNILFRYAEDTEELQEMRFIDFQMPRYASPTLDLQFFLYTSVQADVREQQWDQLLGAYISQLRATLEALGHAEEAQKITQEVIEEDMKERASFGLVFACTTLVAVMADPTDPIVMDDTAMKNWEKGDAGIVGKVMTGKRYNDALKSVFSMFVKNGTLK